MKKNNNWNLLWNPFIRVAGWQAFGVGIIIVLISAVLASYGNLAFDGAIDAHFGDNITSLNHSGYRNKPALCCTCTYVVADHF